MRTRLLVLLTLVLFFTGAVKAQDSFEKAEALFIYNFTRHIGWPMQSLTGEFVIGLVGDKALYDEVSSLTTGKTVGTNKIVVKSFASPAEISTCHILVIGTKFRAKTEEIKTGLGTAAVLLINAGDGRITNVAGIGFKIVDEKMRFEMHKKNILAVGLQVSAQLEKMAIVWD